MYNYKFCIIQALHPNDSCNRHEFCENILICTQEDDNLKKYIFVPMNLNFARKEYITTFGQAKNHIYSDRHAFK